MFDRFATNLEDIRPLTFSVARRGSLFARLRLNEQAVWPLPRPAQPFFATGDIHGCFDLLQNILHQINAIDPDALIVFIGNLVDHGENSAAVLRCLSAGSPRIDVVADA